MRPRFVVQQGRIVVTQFPQPPPYTPVTCVDRPVYLVSACSVTNEAIAEICRVDDSFPVMSVVCMRVCERVRVRVCVCVLDDRA